MNSTGLGQAGDVRAKSPVRSFLRAVALWFDSAGQPADGEAPDDGPDRVDWPRVIPFVGMHLACLFVLVVGWSPIAVGVAVSLYWARMFAITAWYHRYFSHRAFETSRAVQFAFACLGASAVQRGPLWWAAHHRQHHRASDTQADAHSPREHGFLWSHVGWFLSKRNFRTRTELVKDLARFPELRWLDRFDVVVPVLLAGACWLLGWLLERFAPALGTSAWQMLVWGFVISTVVLYHGTFTINSLAHRFGKRRFATQDDSRNNLWLALLTMGEGWHNNHHRAPGAVRQGFVWWEVDVSYYVLLGMQRLGLVKNLRPVPPEVLRGLRTP